MGGKEVGREDGEGRKNPAAGTEEEEEESGWQGWNQREQGVWRQGGRRGRIHWGCTLNPLTASPPQGGT